MLFKYNNDVLLLLINNILLYILYATQEKKTYRNKPAAVPSLKARKSKVKTTNTKIYLNCKAPKVKQKGKTISVQNVLY